MRTMILSGICIWALLLVSACGEDSNESSNDNNANDTSDSNDELSTDSNNNDADPGNYDTEALTHNISFEGNYIGTYQNNVDTDLTGFVTATIDEEGNMSVYHPAEDAEGTGAVQDDGTTAFTFGSGTEGDETVVWEGSFRATDMGIVGNGTWTSSVGTNGTWQAWNDTVVTPTDASLVSATCTYLLSCDAFTMEDCEARLSCQTIQAYAWSVDCYDFLEQQLEAITALSDDCSAIEEEPPDLTLGGCIANMDTCYGSDFNGL